MNAAGTLLLLLSNMIVGQGRGEKAEETVIQIGGVHDAKATLVTSASGDYTITVEMSPLDYFDSGTNRQLTQAKARSLALQALAKHLTRKPDVRMEISGVEVVSTGTRGKVYSLTLRVPKGRVRLEPEEPEPPAKSRKADIAVTERIVSASAALLTRKQDYLDTLQRLKEATVTGLAAAKKAPTNADEDRPFLVAISEMEERGEANLKSLAREVEGDRLLLSVEKRELLRAVEQQRDELLRMLKEAVRKRAPKPRKEKSS